MIRTIITILCLFSEVLLAQPGISNIWLAGYDGGLGDAKMDFYQGAPVITTYPVPMDFNHTLATMSDDQGNMLFYTNGYFIADASNDTMLNGSGINPGLYANDFPDGFLLPQGALILKKPGNNSLYYLFHNSDDNYPLNISYSYYLYLTIIDMNGNGGMGSVILKNYPIITDTLNTGKITSCRHANGRDWWVVCHRANSNKYYKLLVTPYGLPSVNSQNIGTYRNGDAGQVKFSSDGSRFAYYHYNNGLDLLDFDRCSGLFSNAVSDSTLPVIPGNVGCEFSPNSQFLYVTNILNTYQYDVFSTNFVSSRIEVAVWDTFHEPGIPNLFTYMCLPQLAPDGKIYITTGNSTSYFGAINSPDIAGVACDVAQHSVLLPVWNFNTIPNHPNYFLGNIPGSPCDTITGVGIDEPPEIKVKAWPNPASEFSTLSFPVQSSTGNLALYDNLGRRIFDEQIAPWSQFKRVNVSGYAPGFYIFELSWGNTTETVKIMIE